MTIANIWLYTNIIASCLLVIFTVLFNNLKDFPYTIIMISICIILLSDVIWDYIIKGGNYNDDGTK